MAHTDLRSAHTDLRDLADTQVATDGGVHIAALGGDLQMPSVFGFAGLSLRNDGVTIDPQLPADWHSVAFRILAAWSPPQDEDRSEGAPP